MLRRILLMLSVLAIAIAGTSFVMAQDGATETTDNDPLTNPDANACYAGGSMEGKCDTEWEWTCGWHLIRYESNLISYAQFPVECGSLVTLLTPPEDICTPLSDSFALSFPVGSTAFFVETISSSCAQLADRVTTRTSDSSIATVLDNQFTCVAAGVVEISTTWVQDDGQDFTYYLAITCIDGPL